MRDFCLFLSILLAACAGSRSGMREVVLVSGRQELVIRAEIADTPEEHEQGLMGRTELCGDCGMLFVFSESRPLSFWMKNTLIPLDVLFFDSEGEFVGVRTMGPCVADPCPTYASPLPAKYALEVNAGFFDERWRGRLRDSGEWLRLRFPAERSSL